MNILRKPPLPLSASYTVPDASTSYAVEIKESSRDIIVFEDTLESSVDSILTIQLSDYLSKYDDSYHISIYELIDGELADIVIEDNLNIERPYVDPSTLGNTASEIAQYTEYESIARSIIDAITGGFYYYVDWIETTGQNTDYLPLWDRVYKILNVYENAELVWDSSQDPSALGHWNYILTKDKTAITKDPVTQTGAENRAESNPVGLYLAPSDSLEIFDTEDSGNTFALKVGTVFPQGWDYLISYEGGYKVVPMDIQDATRMLINDIKCGKLDYFKRYITSYNTDQFRIQIDKSAFSGTGNIIVDKILEKYMTDVVKPGVL
jgi:hypothetical protein